MPSRLKNSPHAKLNTYIGYEEKRIKQSTMEGALTKAESAVLTSETKKLRAAVTEAMKDGFISASEENKLDEQLSLLSNHVAELDQNAEVSTLEYGLTLIGNSIFSAANAKDLTKAEAKALNKELAEVRTELQQARARGELTPDDLDAIGKATNALADELKKNVKNPGRVVSKLGVELRLARIERRLDRIANDPRTKRDHAVSGNELNQLKTKAKAIRAALTAGVADGALTVKERTKIRNDVRWLSIELNHAVTTPAEWW